MTDTINSTINHLFELTKDNDLSICNYTRIKDMLRNIEQSQNQRVSDLESQIALLEVQLKSSKQDVEILNQILKSTYSDSDISLLISLEKWKLKSNKTETK